MRSRPASPPAVVLLIVSMLAAGACRQGGTSVGKQRTDDSATTVVGGADGADGGARADALAFVQAKEVPGRDRPKGGTARVGVWAAPDPAAPTSGGAAVRALVLPQLFVARPDGRWSPALAEPGSDRTSEDQLSATFRLRRGATWSDGAAITADDLRRSADGRFVGSVEGPAEDGTIALRFTDRLPGWRRLWSAQDSIAPPAAGVWGGPFVVALITPGLETVLAPNPRWWGSGGPFLDEVRLVLVPDATTARQLLAKGDLDVVMPLAATGRTDQLEKIPGVKVDRKPAGGWTVALETNPMALSPDKRRALFASVDRGAFVRTLLAGEAGLLEGFNGPGDQTWAGAGAGDVGPLKGDIVDLVGFAEEPMTGLLHRSMQKRVRGAQGTVELRQAEAERVEGWLREGSYEAAIVVALEPLGRCWRCRWPDVSGAAAADTADPASVAAFEATLRDEARVLPLWRSDTVVAVRSGLSGVKANGYAASAAWNAWEWWRAGG